MRAGTSRGDLDMRMSIYREPKIPPEAARNRKEDVLFIDRLFDRFYYCFWPTVNIYAIVCFFLVVGEVVLSFTYLNQNHMSPHIHATVHIIVSGFALLYGGGGILVRMYRYYITKALLSDVNTLSLSDLKEDERAYRKLYKGAEDDEFFQSLTRAWEKRRKELTCPGAVPEKEKHAACGD